MAAILETDRLTVRPFTEDDAPFILRQLNEPSFIQNVTDRGIRNLEDAQRYVRDVLLASYEKHGFGLWRASLKHNDVPIALAGLVQRDFLDDIDLGYAVLPEFWRQGYAFEVAAAILSHARLQLGRPRVLAIVNQDNQPSIRLLEKLGFKFERMIQLEGETKKVRLYAVGR